MADGKCPAEHLEKRAQNHADFLENANAAENIDTLSQYALTEESLTRGRQNVKD
jgi:hypothetical protein